jgi:SAM-dependent methyltransferase
MTQWFENWFDSPFYHKLYFDRDEQEASAFIHRLISHLQPPPGSFMLDIACGKGRHSKILATYGHYVTGIDLSANSIAFAKQYEDEHLEFYQHDMRQPFRINYFNYAVNLFTSFGYFATQREHDDTLRTIAQSIKKGGCFVIDYLNSAYWTQHLVTGISKTIDGTQYDIEKWIANGLFHKKITVTDPGLATPMSFTEHVAAFTLAGFEKMFAKQGLAVEAVFGDYNLQPFHETESKRLILIARK